MNVTITFPQLRFIGPAADLSLQCATDPPAGIAGPSDISDLSLFRKPYSGFMFVLCVTSVESLDSHIMCSSVELPSDLVIDYLGFRV